MAVVRYHADGTLDTTFGGSGIVTTSLGSGEDKAYDVTVQPDGRLVLGGFYNGLGVIRYTADGSLDASFNGTGVALLDDWWSVTDLALQPDGRIVVAGHASGGGYALARIR